MKVLAWFGFIIITLQAIKLLVDVVRDKTTTDRAAALVSLAIKIPAELFFIFYLF